MEKTIFDYHDISDVNTTSDERKKLGIGDIYSNAIKCHTCGYYIRSKNCHHMIACNCDDKDYRIVVDGGSFYHKISAGSKASWGSCIILYNDVEEKAD